MVKAFCRELSPGMKHGFITLNNRQKGSQWNSINQHFLKENFEVTPAAGGHCFFWDAEGVISVDISHMVKPLTRICTFKLSESHTVISGEFSLIHLVIPGVCSMNYIIITNTEKLYCET